MADILTQPTGIKSLLKHHHLFPKKRLGQHFLVDEGALGTIVAAAKLTKKDTVLEIGPGLGVLTGELVKRAGKVIAVEKDAKMVAILKERLGSSKNLEIISDDILKLISHISSLITHNYKLVANLPYNITSPVIRQVLESPSQPKLIVLTIQKEVAERLCAKPGESNRGILSVMVQYYSQPEIIAIIPQTSFWPPPKVESAIIRLTPIRRYQPSDKEFFKIVKAGFSSKRRQLVNSLAGGLGLPKETVSVILKEAGVNAKKRAEDLSLKEWDELRKTWHKQRP